MKAPPEQAQKPPAGGFSFWWDLFYWFDPRPSSPAVRQSSRCPAKIAGLSASTSARLASSPTARMLQSHLLLFHVDLDDLELVLLALFQLERLAVVAGLGDVAQTLHALRNLDKRAELRRTQNLAMHHVAHAMRGEEGLPHIGLQAA